MEDAIAKAKILMQALPYIKQYSGKKVVIKYGGKAMTDQQLKQSVANDLTLMHFVGLNPVVIHGGGPEISQAMKKKGLEPKFVDGLRVTDKQAIDIVAEVAGTICDQIADNINKHGDLATAFCGDLIKAKKKKHEEADLGFVGDVAEVDTEKLNQAVEEGQIPVISSIGTGDNGQRYNINADSVAASVAEALEAEKLIFLTDVDGVYAKSEEPDTLISVLGEKQAKAQVESNKISGGMLPKVKACVEALEAGVHRCHILNGTIQHALLLEIFTDEGIGTMMMKNGNSG